MNCWSVDCKWLLNCINIPLHSDRFHVLVLDDVVLQRHLVVHSAFILKRTFTSDGGFFSCSHIVDGTVKQEIKLVIYPVHRFESCKQRLYIVVYIIIFFIVRTYYFLRALNGEAYVELKSMLARKADVWNKLVPLESSMSYETADCMYYYQKVNLFYSRKEKMSLF